MSCFQNWRNLNVDFFFSTLKSLQVEIAKKSFHIQNLNSGLDCQFFFFIQMERIVSKEKTKYYFCLFSQFFFYTKITFHQIFRFNFESNQTEISILFELLCYQRIIIVFKVQDGIFQNSKYIHIQKIYYVNLIFYKHLQKSLCSTKIQEEERSLVRSSLSSLTYALRISSLFFPSGLTRFFQKNGMDKKAIHPKPIKTWCSPTESLR